MEVITMKAKVVCLRSKNDFDRVNVTFTESLDVHFFEEYDEDIVARACADADFLMAPSPFPPITAKIISGAKSLRLIQLTGSGFDTVDLQAADKAKIPVANCPGQNSKTVAQLAFITIGALSRGVIEGDIETKKGNFQEVRKKLQKEGMYEFENLNLGLLGLGLIGKEMAKIGAFFGLNLYYYDIQRLTPKQEKKFRVTFTGFEELLRVSDIVSIHLPMNESTKKLLGPEEFALMKPNSILINTSRGPIIDDEALIQALRSDRLKGAALDAFDREPLPREHPLLSLNPEIKKRLILTPHIGGSSRQSFKRMFQEAIKNVLRVLKGEKPKHVVNLR
jgi:lactate dehydrogenase-like 2-hydroxyacid dehydrogenase